MSHIAMVLIGDIRYDGRVRKEIETLARAGHCIDLIISDFSQDGFGGEDLGIRIHYVPMKLWPSPLLNFLEQLLFNRKAAAILKNLPITHIHCHDLSCLLAGVWAKKQLRAKLIFDAHELMPESMGGLKEVIWGQIEKRYIDSCDDIIMPEKNRIAYLKRKYANIPEPVLLENFPCKGEIPTETFDLFRISYPTGTICPGRYIEELIDSMALCGKDLALVILGRAFKGYEECLRTKIEKYNLGEKVFFHGPVAHATILQYMASCDIGIALYSNTNLNNYFCASNKLYEYIALCKIVITNDYPGLLDAVKRFKQGICLSDITPEVLAEAYIYAIEPVDIIPGARKFFWEDQTDVLIQLYS